MTPHRAVPMKDKIMGHLTTVKWCSRGEGKFESREIISVTTKILQ